MRLYMFFIYFIIKYNCEFHCRKEEYVYPVAEIECWYVGV